MEQEKKNQQERTDRRKTTSLNLKYIVGEKPPPRPIPWPLVLLLLSLAMFIAIGIWLAISLQKESYHIHVVKQGETLRSLAAAYYENPKKWKRIYWANHDNLKQSQTIKVGDAIRIPLTREEKISIIEREKKRRLRQQRSR